MISIVTERFSNLCKWHEDFLQHDADETLRDDIVHIMADSCHRLGCKKSGTKFCGACRDARYCSIQCQRADWKVHKLKCVKKLINDFLHVDTVSQLIKKSFDKAISLKAQRREDEAIEELENSILFANNQFGCRIHGETHRIRGNGDRVDDWQVMTMPICLQLVQLTSLYIDQGASGSLDRALIHAVEARELVEPYRASIEYGELDYVSTLFSRIESHLADIHMENSNFIDAEHHCMESLAFARKSRSVDRPACMFEGLRKFGILRRQQQRLGDALSFCEEAYIVVSRAYGPVHPLVQDASAELIETLILLQEYSQAEAYSRITYESLIDPRNGIDPESESVARGMQQLASLCFNMAHDGHECASDLINEAEELSRKACCIIENLNNGFSSSNLAICLETLGQVLVGKKNFTEETKGLFERILNIYSERENGNGPGTLKSLRSLGEFHFKLANTLPIGIDRNKQCETAKLIYDEALNMAISLSGPNATYVLEYTERARQIQKLILEETVLTDERTEQSILYIMNRDTAS